MAKKTEPIAVSGEIVTCTRGHRVCAIAEQLHQVWPLKASSFTEWEPAARPTTPEIENVKCPVIGCPGVWVSDRRDAIRVKQQWRTA